MQVQKKGPNHYTVCTSFQTPFQMDVCEKLPSSSPWEHLKATLQGTQQLKLRITINPILNLWAVKFQTMKSRETKSLTTHISYLCITNSWTSSKEDYKVEPLHKKISVPFTLKHNVKTNSSKKRKCQQWKWLKRVMLTIDSAKGWGWL